jgi:YegS/Rv2252/BmrU family lipid kinase
MPSIEVIINAGGGSFVEGETERLVSEAFASQGLEIDLRLAKNGADISDFAQAAVKSAAKIVVAGGGDGTISSVAGVVQGTAKTFGVLPLGTLNNFSKDLGIPQEIASAVKVIAAGHTDEVDVAEVNGRIFINNSSIGLYPSIVRRREQQQRLGKGKWWAAFWSALQMFRRGRFVHVRIEADGKSFRRKTPFVFVGNNEYEMDLYNIGRRPVIDNGKLSVYFLHRGGRAGVIVMLLRTLSGTVKQWHEFEAVVTDQVTIETHRGLIPVALDGEVAALGTPLIYRSLPKALRVIVPAPEDSE